MDYTTAFEDSKMMGERNDCAVKAAAIATGTDYATVNTMFAQLGRKKGRGSDQNWTPIVIDKLGYDLKDVTSSARRKGALTVRSAERVLGSGVYLVRVAGHILCVKNGHVQDWTAGRQHRVKQIYKVMGRNAQTQAEAPVQQPTAPRKLQVKVGPAQPKQGSVRDTIHNVANSMWIANDRPTDIAVLRKLRARMMDFLELTHGIKRTTASTELGQWQKGIL